MEMYGLVHFGLNTFQDKEWGYGDASPGIFNPVKFDALQIVRGAKSAGLKGLILVAKHHDGFCLWDTQLSAYKATNTPAGRDLVGPFVEACRHHGIAVGFYYSLIDWNHPHFTIDFIHPMRHDPVVAAQKRDMRVYAEYMRGQIRELQAATNDVRNDNQRLQAYLDSSGTVLNEGKARLASLSGDVKSRRLSIEQAEVARQREQQNIQAMSNTLTAAKKTRDEYIQNSAKLSGTPQDRRDIDGEIARMNRQVAQLEQNIADYNRALVASRA